MMKKRVFNLLASLLMLMTTLTALPVTSFAADEICTLSNDVEIKSVAIAMPSDAINFEYSSSFFKAVDSAQKGGVYYFNNGKISFYNASSNTVQTMAEISDAIDVYADSSKIYVLRSGWGSYAYRFFLDTYDTLNDTLSTKEITEFAPSCNFLSMKAVGVDSKGRYYIAVYDAPNAQYVIHLYSSNWKELSSVSTDESIYRFNGFDATNGNFYFEGYKNWIYWGYDHDTDALKCGNVSGNTITLSPSYINILYQLGYTKTGLTKGKTYYFTVKAYRTVDGKTYNGKYTTKNVKIK